MAIKVGFLVSKKNLELLDVDLKQDKDVGTQNVSVIHGNFIYSNFLYLTKEF